MAHVLIMPRQGNTVESCIIQEWKVKEADAVSAETTVCVVETDKATFDIPAGAAGTVLKILRAGGDDVPVLEAIAVIGAAGEDWQAALGGAAATEAAVNAASDTVTDTVSAAQTDTVAAAVTDTDKRDPAAAGGSSPRARNLAAKTALPLAGLAGSGPGGRVIERDVAAALEGRPPLSAAAAAALAAGAAIPAAGAGLGGRVTLADLDRPDTAGGESLTGEVTETPIKGIRKLIAGRMLASLAESAQFTLNAGAPAASMQELRKKMKASASGKNGDELGVGKITVNDIVLFAVSRVLPRFPFMNALKIGDSLKTYRRVHLGVAVDTPRGLMVPVIRGADLLSLKQISAEAKRLSAACQDGSVKAEELSGSTFTVTNLGSFGVSGFTPVLNAPEVAILGVCGIELKPVEDDEGAISFAPHIGFSLTINHQVVDGAPAARFLKALCGAIAEIGLLLAGA
ncbi:MAG: 2-oxo acid dehydrogenase subunit E2 [Treponema sp.]|jgi:pyruvate dehydrogenase E2 component (dihydrolipoamide acetyltransferase)|nr:2-oxo acid dehydrogenase subunit E2 [Treponema sp.]